MGASSLYEVAPVLCVWCNVGPAPPTPCSRSALITPCALCMHPSVHCPTSTELPIACTVSLHISESEPAGTLPQRPVCATCSTPAGLVRSGWVCSPHLAVAAALAFWVHHLQPRHGQPLHDPLLCCCRIGIRYHELHSVLPPPRIVKRRFALPPAESCPAGTRVAPEPLSACRSLTDLS